MSKISEKSTKHFSVSHIIPGQVFHMPDKSGFQELAWEEFVGRATFLIRSHISSPQGVLGAMR